MSEHNIHVSAGESLRLLTAGTYCDRDILITTDASGGAAAQVFDAAATGTRATLSVTGLPSQPKAFSLLPASDFSVNSNPGYVLSVLYDGATTHGVYTVRSGYSPSYTYTATYSTEAITWNYSDGTLLLSVSGANFRSGAYKFLFVL
ncbi:MAG: hypothetical protein IKU17_03995 [Clostridia bacterium]|nr:hypothetical protein [Clostridia bacterium]